MHSALAEGQDSQGQPEAQADAGLMGGGSRSGVCDSPQTGLSATAESEVQNARQQRFAPGTVHLPYRQLNGLNDACQHAMRRPCSHCASHMLARGAPGQSAG